MCAQRQCRSILIPARSTSLSALRRSASRPPMAAEMAPSYLAMVGEVPRPLRRLFSNPGIRPLTRQRCRSRGRCLRCAATKAPFVLNTGQIVGRLVYNGLRAEPSHFTGGRSRSKLFQGQGLKLSKHFRMADSRAACPCFLASKYSKDHSAAGCRVPGWITSCDTPCWARAACRGLADCLVALVCIHRAPPWAAFPPRPDPDIVRNPGIDPAIHRFANEQFDHPC